MAWTDASWEELPDARGVPYLELVLTWNGAQRYRIAAGSVVGLTHQQRHDWAMAQAAALAQSLRANERAEQTPIVTIVGTG